MGMGGGSGPAPLHCDERFTVIEDIQKPGYFNVYSRISNESLGFSLDASGLEVLSLASWGDIFDRLKEINPDAAKTYRELGVHASELSLVFGQAAVEYEERQKRLK